MTNRHRSVTARIAGLLAIAMLVAAVPVGGVVAMQDGPSPLTGDDLGLPELVITATDEGWEAPEEIAAGRYLVTVTYNGEREFGTTAFALLPEDWSVDDFNQRLAELVETENPVATPGTSVSSTEPDLSWLNDVTLAGGVSPTPGTTEQGIVDLPAGNWAIWADAFAPAAIPLTVTGETSAVQPIPETAVIITGVSDGETFGFEVEGTITAEQQIIEIFNTSSQPMYIEFLKLSTPVTDEQLQGFLATPSGLAPDPALELPADFAYEVTPFYSAIQSDGVRQWIVTAFEPGAYGMVCWLPDPQHGGESHASMGMISTFEVE